ncbi:MAG: HAD family hydrolase [Lachnospiraceae bacterium]|nr:HAD family hydrolase [Lachnospiraceae bacterium]MDY4971114.1 HAD family hydrolase [Lachnospiraceae bacterium]
MTDNKLESNPRKILSFDLDMTLVDDQTNKIPQSALDAIDRVRNDYHIVIATGRDLNLAANQFVLEQVRPEAWVHNNGTQVHINGRQIYYRTFDKTLLKKLLTFCQEHGICICCILNNVQYTTNREKLKPILHILAGDHTPEWGDINDLPELPVQTLGLVGDEEQAEFMRRAFPELKFPTVIPGIWCDVMEPDVSKVLGMQKLLDYYGCTMDDVIAFGDSMNDYEILSAAGYSVAMGNAADKLKEIADLVTDDVDKDGIAKALELICRK